MIKQKQYMDAIWDKYRRNSKGWEKDAIAKVHSRIYMGSAKDVDLFTFSSLGITHAVNCAEDWVSNKWYLEECPEQYACIGALDHKTEDITKWYPEFQSVMNKFLVNPNCNSIYVHCECGINRSGFLLLMYLCIKFGMSPEVVATNILKQRPCALTNPSFRVQAIDYIKKHQ